MVSQLIMGPGSKSRSTWGCDPAVSRGNLALMKGINFSRSARTPGSAAWGVVSNSLGGKRGIMIAAVTPHSVPHVPPLWHHGMQLMSERHHLERLHPVARHHGDEPIVWARGSLPAPKAEHESKGCMSFRANLGAQDPRVSSWRHLRNSSSSISVT